MAGRDVLFEPAAVVIATTTVSGSMPPTSQNTDGTPVTRPKSSLPVTSGAGMTRDSPK